MDPLILNTAAVRERAAANTPDELAVIAAEVAMIQSSNKSKWFSRPNFLVKATTEFINCGVPILSQPDSAPLPLDIDGALIGATYINFLDHRTGEHHDAVVIGSWSNSETFSNHENIPVRVHYGCRPQDIFFGTNGSKTNEIEEALREMVKAGCGVLVFIDQDGRGGGALAQIKALGQRYAFNTEGKIERTLNADGTPVTTSESLDRLGYPQSLIDYSAPALILEALGVSSIRLLSQSAEKARGLSQQGIRICNLDEFNVKISATPANRQEPIEVDSRKALALQARIRHLHEIVFKPWEEVARRQLLFEAVDVPIIELLELNPLPTSIGDWTLMAFGDHSTPEGLIHNVLWYGDYGKTNSSEEKLLIRVHSSCRTNECFCSANCECKLELKEAMERIQERGRGAIVFVDQEGRGTGIHGKMAQLRQMYGFDDQGQIFERRDESTGAIIRTAEAYAREDFPSEARNLRAAAEMLQYLGIHKVEMMTNNPRKTLELNEFGITVTQVPIISIPSTLPAWRQEMLRGEHMDKADSLGHNIPQN